MKGVSLHVHNFRSIEDVDIELRPYSLLVGPNNSGKSNLIAAIRVFYEKGLKFEEQRDFPKFQTKDKESWIEIQYEPDQDEWSQLKNEYKLPDGTFRVRKYFKSEEKDDEGKKKEGIYAYINEKLSGSRFYGAKNVQQGKLGDVIYIPAVSKLDEHTKLTGPSALRDLLNTVLKGVLASSSSYKELSSAFEEFEGKIKKKESEEGHSLSRLEEHVSAELAEWGVKYELLISPIQPPDIIKSLISHQIIDNVLETAQEPSAFGDGFQRQLIFTLIRLAAYYEPKKIPTAKKEFSPSFNWILFEEPEAFLHPSQIEVLDRNLRIFANADGQQVMISSHSPQFASLNVEELPMLIRLNREDVHTKVGQIRSVNLQNILTANQTCLSDLAAAGVQITSDDLCVDMESIKYALWLNPLRSTSFFAQRVLLVEGPSERVLTAYLIAEEKLELPKGGITVIDTMGKWNIHRFMNLLAELRIPHAVLYDKDAGKPESPALEKAIRNASNDFTRGVDFFDDDIEAFLGIQKTRTDRKPQHLMWHLKQGKIDQDKLTKLCKKLQLLIDS